jgi:NAD-dependent deacetylase
MNVYPAAGLLYYAKPQCEVFLIDPNEVRLNADRPIHIIQKGASEGVKELWETLKG